MYFKISYKPSKIKPIDQVNFPEEYHISNVPCISYKTAYCATASYQMACYQKGLHNDIDFYNWVMGFTYGAMFNKKNNSFIPYNDPETGFVAARNYTAIKRHYLTTNDSVLFINSVKYYISRGEPLRVGLNPAILRHKKGFSPHSELIIGYTKDSLFYYETGVYNRYISNYRGEACSWADFVKSVSSFCITMGYPWKYNISVFEKIKPDTLGLLKCSKRNGELLIGRKNGPYFRTGSCALKEYGDYIKKCNNELNWANISQWIEQARVIRRDNAGFIKRKFSNNADAIIVAEMLLASGEKYAEIWGLINTKNYNKETIGNYLIQCGKLENQAGQLLLKISKE
jgi:hypothetical protein